MTRWLFLGLIWLAVADGGILEDRPLRIKAQILPYDEAVNVDDMLDHLVQVGLINRERDHRDDDGGVTYIAIVDWEKRWLLPEPEDDDEVPA